MKYAILSVLALVWGSSFILMERGLDAFSPIQIAALRICIASVVLIPFLWGKARQLSKKEWIYACERPSEWCEKRSRSH